MIPGAAHGSDTKVFRIACELKETVDPALLQSALLTAVQEFPHFHCTMKRGLFWYYLEDSRKKPVVTEDTLPALSPIYREGQRNHLYRVCYRGRRINLEIYHVLADGTGALAFFRYLLECYLHLAHDLGPVAPSDHTSREARVRDAFDQYYTKGPGRKQLRSLTTRRAFRVRGVKDPDLRNHLLEGTVSASAFVEAAHRFDTTAGILMTALYIEAILQNVKKREKKPVIISVPVNLRQFFHSETARNFFGIITVTFHPGDYDGDLAKIIDAVKEAFRIQLDEESLRGTMNSYAKLEHNIAVKVVPLVLKDLGIQFFYFLLQFGFTATVSNLGRMTLPDELVPYVDRFGAFMTSPNPHMCVCSFGDKMVFGGVSPYLTNPIQTAFYRRLTELGIRVELASNDYDEETEVR